MEAKIKSLIDNLLTKTTKKEANWDRMGKSEQFVLFLENAKVSIDRSLTNKNNIYYQFSIINVNGDSIFNVNGLKNDFLPPDKQDYTILQELHEEIKKAYFKVDETIEGLLGEIKKDGEIGKDDPNALPF